MGPRLPKPQSDEADLLKELPGYNPSESRLSCKSTSPSLERHQDHHPPDT